MADGKGSQTPVRDVMTNDVKYVFDDEDIKKVTSNMADQQVRCLPVINRDKRLVGIISLADLATSKARDRAAAQALHGIARPGGKHTQAQALRRLARRPRPQSRKACPSSCVSFPQGRRPVPYFAGRASVASSCCWLKPPESAATVAAGLGERAKRWLPTAPVKRRDRATPGPAKSGGAQRALCESARPSNEKPAPGLPARAAFLSAAPRQ